MSRRRRKGGSRPTTYLLLFFVVVLPPLLSTAAPRLTPTSLRGRSLEFTDSRARPCDDVSSRRRKSVLRLSPLARSNGFSGPSRCRDWRSSAREPTARHIYRGSVQLFAFVLAAVVTKSCLDLSLFRRPSRSPPCGARVSAARLASSNMIRDKANAPGVDARLCVCVS